MPCHVEFESLTIYNFILSFQGGAREIFWQNRACLFNKTDLINFQKNY